MLVIQRKCTKIAVTMASIESFKMHTSGTRNTLSVRTKSGDLIQVDHPKDELDRVVTFEMFAEAVLHLYPMWVIIELIA